MIPKEIITGVLVGWVSANGKAQTVRALDVLVLGPLMVYVGSREQTALALRRTLTFAGAATVAYNLRNYLAEQ